MNSMWPLFLPGAISQFISVFISFVVFLVFVGMGGIIYYQKQRIESLKSDLAHQANRITIEQSRTTFTQQNLNLINKHSAKPKPKPVQNKTLILDELFKNEPH